MPTPHAMFRILFVTCLLTRKALRLIIIRNTRLAHGLHVEQFCISNVYIIIHMSFSVTNNLYDYRCVIVPRARVCVCLFVVFCHHVHLDPEI